MAFHVPGQTRGVDPYSSYNSDNVNQHTRLVTRGEDTIVSGLDVDLINVTTVRAHSGIGIKDDVLVHVTEDNVDIDLTDSQWFVESTAMLGTGIYYLVLDYQYSTIKPPPMARFKILKTRGLLTPYYLFLKALTIEDGECIAVSDVDPENPNVYRNGGAINNIHVPTLPTFQPKFQDYVAVVAETKVYYGAKTHWIDLTGAEQHLVAGNYIGSASPGSFIPDSGTFSLTVQHNLNCLPVLVQVYDSTSLLSLTPGDIEIIDENTIKIWVDVLPLGAVRFIVIPSDGNETSVNLVSSYTIDSGKYSATIAHYLNSTLVSVQAYGVTSNKLLIPSEIEILSTNIIKLWFDSIPTENCNVVISNYNAAIVPVLAYVSDSGKYSATINHGLDSPLVFAQGYTSTSKMMIIPEYIEIINTNTCKFWFDTVPTENLNVIVQVYGQYSASTIEVIEHLQIVASSIWTVDISTLSHSYPMVQVMENVGPDLGIVQPVSTIISSGTVTITFSSPKTGKVWVR
jgi:hypothetical protein